MGLGDGEGWGSGGTLSDIWNRSEPALSTDVPWEGPQAPDDHECRIFHREEGPEPERYLILRRILSTGAWPGREEPRFLWVVLDLSRGPRLEAAFRRREAMVNSLLNAIEEVVVRFERDGRISLVNDSGIRLLGRPREAVLGRRLSDFFAPALAWSRDQRVREVLESGKAVRFMDRRGDIWFSHGCFPVCDEEGRTVAVTSVTRDVTAEKRLEEDLREREQFIRLITDNLPGLVFYMDRNQICRFVNRRIVEWLGVTPAELLGRRAQDISGHDLTISSVTQRSAALTGQTVSFDSSLMNPQGRRIRYHATFIPHRDGSGNVLGYVGLVLDITKRAEAEEATRAALSQAETASASKSRFLAAASHDLRQPMQALNIYVGLLARQTRDDKKAHDLVGRLEQSVNALADLLDSLLDISKLDAGIITPKVAPFALKTVLDRMEVEMRPTLEAKGLRFTVMPSSLMAVSDETLVERILRNLLTNAGRYSEKGGVILGCRPRGNRVALQVWDTGIGIPADRRDLIFEEFYQVGNQARDRKQGLGLGLAIVRRLSMLLDHPVTVHSRVGKGTLFEVSLPRATSSEVERVNPAWTAMGLSPIKEGTTAVLIDDDTAVLDSLALLLEDWGFEVVAAQDILEAFEALRGMVDPPSVIVADYRLKGGGTGVAAVKSLRQAFGVPIPGVIVTGDTSPERLREVTESGFKLLHKPVRIHELRAAVASVMGEA
ncbi:MAG: PAS domain-containing protein [Rhodospirillum sp.]|nr:PAS domain-containing protein [Rhodospirillum sp.]MCF8490496.1 PAS domain-containing protein [Rhodospirillum sp.]